MFKVNNKDFKNYFEHTRTAKTLSIGAHFKFSFTSFCFAFFKIYCGKIVKATTLNPNFSKFHSQQSNKCSKSTVETLEKGMKYVQS